MHAGDYYDLLAESGYDVESVEVHKDGPRVQLKPSEGAERLEEARAMLRAAESRPKPMTYLEALGRAIMGNQSAAVRNTIARGVARRAAERA